jgi:hypothetical protein
MRTGWNIGLQLGALLLFTFMRLSVFGWLMVILVVSVIGPILVLVPLGLAIGSRRRGRLAPAVALPFVVTALCLLLAGALIPDFGDTPEAFVPLAGTFSASDPAVDVLNAIGRIAALGFLVGLAWAVVAVTLTRSRAAR